MPDEPPSVAAPAAGRDGGSSSFTDVGGGLRLQDLQHTFEIGPFPGGLPDVEVARFMSQWRVS